jgi:leucyl aminopeptidase
MAGLFSNDDCLSELLSISGEQTGEQLWHFPITDNYRKKVKSDTADLKNISAGRSAGSITAACFLENFLLNKTPWAHLDIAGVDKVEKAKPMYPCGSSGFGVLLLNKFLHNLEQK